MIISSSRHLAHWMLDAPCSTTQVKWWGGPHQLRSPLADSSNWSMRCRVSCSHCMLSSVSRIAKGDAHFYVHLKSFSTAGCNFGVFKSKLSACSIECTELNLNRVLTASPSLLNVGNTSVDLFWLNELKSWCGQPKTVPRRRTLQEHPARFA